MKSETVSLFDFFRGKWQGIDKPWLFLIWLSLQNYFQACFVVKRANEIAGKLTAKYLIIIFSLAFFHHKINMVVFIIGLIIFYV